LYISHKVNETGSGESDGGRYDVYNWVKMIQIPQKIIFFMFQVKEHSEEKM
jgi:hypothetical protein